MNYEKKYKEALERMKSWARGEHPECFCEAQKAAEFIFPELKESDEKVREDIISLVNEFWERIGSINPEYSSRSRMLDWLEKQRETFTKKDVDDAYLKGVCDTKQELEKQGEQPTDKIEPKFKVGDWITDGYIHCKITEVLDDRYIIKSKYCYRSAILFEYENRYHLWTIADTKDGDVLVTGVGKNPFIFKGLLDSNHSNCPVAYCGIDPEGYFCVSLEKYWWTDDKDDVQPATKEQRDLLFQKMKEAGYEWDNEKKELKKVEPKMLDADEVIAWLKTKVYDDSTYGMAMIEKFKKDFGLC